MAKINNVGLNLSQKIANPFKTSRNSTTNPFKYSNFEGNTLQFADVFEGFEPKKINKLKMISASVAGSMTKLRSSITEPIVNFVNRMTTGISNAWDYAKNTTVTDSVKDLGKGISNSVSELGRNISEKMPSINMPTLNMPSLHIGSNISGIGKNLSDKWANIISKINIPHHNKISADMPVCELKSLWENINAEAAIKESKVA